MTAPGTFPATCTCPLERVLCAGNKTDCKIAWVVAENHSAQPTWAGRLFGWLAWLAWWRR